MVSELSRMFSAISFGRLLPGGALDQGDHPVDEGLARPAGDPHDDPVRQHRGAAGDRRAVAAGLADHRRGLAGDGRLVDAGDALDDVAVAGDHLAGDDDHRVAGLQRRRPAPRGRRAGGRRSSSAPCAGVAACALPRPSATASARLANSTVSHSQPAMSQPNSVGSATASTVEKTEPTQTTKITGWRSSARGSSLRSGAGERRADLVGGQEGAGGHGGRVRTGRSRSTALRRAVPATAPGSR